MCKDTICGKEIERPVMSPWELMWITYSKLDSHEFRKEKGLTYDDIMDIDEDPERFAEMILRFPELYECFSLEQWLYNQKY